tara:strand:- start:428 stop:1030 length:603 start_codon:yes stop_codon:yes gene_type:complete
MKTFTMKEVSEMLGISYRAVRYYKDIFTNDVIQDGRIVLLSSRFVDKVRNNRKPRSPMVDRKTKVEYKNELEELTDKHKKALQDQKEIYETRLGVLSELDYDAENERIEVFSNEEYVQFENALIDYRHQKREIELKELHFKNELASKDEIVEHYKQQTQYQKEQSDRILSQMDNLIDAIRRRDTIEAVEKNVISKKIDLD